MLSTTRTSELRHSTTRIHQRRGSRTVVEGRPGSRDRAGVRRVRMLMVSLSDCVHRSGHAYTVRREEQCAQIFVDVRWMRTMYAGRSDGGDGVVGLGPGKPGAGTAGLEPGGDRAG